MANTKTTNKVAENQTAETKKTEQKVTEKKPVKKTVKKDENKEKKNITLTVDEVVKAITEAGIKISNPDAKGAYRIMGSKKGSSLHVQKSKYVVFTTDEDFKNLTEVKDKYKDLVLIEKGNAQDHARPNKVEATTEATLKGILKIYAKNPFNKVAAK